MSNPTLINELRRIANAHNGILKPQDVVDAARPKSSPLHSRFEWDNSHAAEQYRLWQARQLIAITVEYIGGDENAVLSKVFVSLTSDRDRGGYRSLVTVLSDEQQRERLLADALDELRRFHKKYKDLDALASIFAEIAKVSKTAQVSRRGSSKAKSATVNA